MSECNPYAYVKYIAGQWSFLRSTEMNYHDATSNGWMPLYHADELTTLRAQVQELEGREPRPEPITDESFPEDEQVLLGHYDERENMWLWVSSGHFDSEAEKWFCDWSDDYFPPVGHQGITHWMPLPSPPPEDKSDG